MEKNLKKDTILYAVITFAISWGCWGVLILFNLPAKSTWYTYSLYMLGGFATLIVALIMPLFRSKEARREYYKRFFRFQIPFSQYILSIIIAPIMYGISCLLVLLFNRDALFSLAIQPAYMILPLFVTMIVGGGIEEFGWRGVMVGNLKKHNPIWIALAIGCIWSLWHLPLFFIQGINQYQANYPAFCLSVLGLSFVLTMLYLKTESVIPCVIFHAMFNAMAGLGFFYANDQGLAVWLDSFAKLAVGIATYAVLAYAKNKSQNKQLNAKRQV